MVTGCYQVTAPWPRVLMVEVASWRSHLFYKVFITSDHGGLV